MKLKTKFSIIVAITVLQVIILTYSLIAGSRKMNKLKNYQYVQSEVRGDLNGLIVYLSDMDYRAFRSTTAYREWAGKVNSLDENFDYLINDPVTKSFNDSFKENLESTATIWEMLKTRFEPIEAVLQEMQEIKLSVSSQNEVQTYGIRDSYEKLGNEDENIARLFELVEQAHPEIDGIIRSRDTLGKLNNQNAVEIAELLRVQQKGFTIFALLVAVGSSLFLAILILIVTSRIAKRIKSIEDVTFVLAKKDFSVDIEPNGSSEMFSLMTNINKMVNQINDFFVVVKTTATKAISSGYTITDVANSTAAASGKIEESLDVISKEFEDITTAVQKAVTVISEMNTHIDTLVENNEKQTAALEDSNNSVNNVVDTLESMNRMAIKRTESAQEMYQLVADGDSKISATKNILSDITGKLDEIREVVTIINGVANKTNLLSMNAAIESAHAGEAGKGFGVVAAEIRSLAEATQKNSVRISDVVQNIINSVSVANDSSKAASVAFSKVSTQAEEIVSALQEITSDIGKIDDQMHQIKDKATETSDAAKNINKYCGDISDKQLLVSKEVDSMNDLFVETTLSIRKMKKGTQDIVDRMQYVTTSSKESYKNMTDLENILDEFTTKGIVDEADKLADQENLIETAVSEDILNNMMAEADVDIPVEDKEEITFSLEDVDEYEN